MVNKILTASGIKYRRGRFTGKLPEKYIVYMDDHDTSSGPDRFPGAPLLVQHDITVELYTVKPDDAAEIAVEKAITDAGIHYTKQDRYWLQTEQLYQTIYEFTYIEKRRA